MTTREQNIETIRKACIAANPEIVELKLGCEVIATHSEIGVWRGLLGHPKRTGNAWQCGEKQPQEMMGTIFIHRVNIREIIGRPIRCADVLNVILEESRYKLPHELDGLTRHQWRNERWIEVLYEWNLPKDNLTDQSDETLAFLASLL